MAFAYTERMVQKLCFVELISDLLKKRSYTQVNIVYAG
jgi:hypothetical protein